MESLLTALVEQFPDDPSTPSVVLSKLPNGNYYGSIVRYSKPFGEGKSVLFRCQAATVGEILSKFAEQLGVKVDGN